MPRAGADEELAGCMMDELLFHDAAGALALAADDDDAFVDSLLRLEGADPAASADDLEVALLAGEMLLDAAHPAPLALYDDDAATDVASESASPPPALADFAAGSPAPSPASPALSSAASSPCQPYSPPRVVSTAATPSARRAAPAIRPAPPQKADPTAPSHVAALPFPTNALPYALPIAYFPAAALNANQKRPFTEVFPGDSTDAQVDSKSSGGVDSGNDHSAKKSKREIRQMKNRESANKSRLKRKAQLSELSTEVAELKKKEQELQMVIAGLRAENKSLQNQNSFLQSLVTNFKHGEHSANSAPPALALQPRQYQQQPQKLIASCDHHPSIPSHTNFIALPMIDMMDLESYQESEEEFALIEKRSVKRKRSSLKSLTTASAATLTMCASVFGITLLTNYDGDYTATSHIRHSGRVLHEAGPTSPALGAEGCSPDQPSLAGLLWDKLLSAWAVLSSSDLAYGVLLNVLSFMIIMMVYHWWQQPSSSEPTKHKTSRSHCDARGSRSAHRRHRICGHEVNGSMKQRSASWQPQTPEDHGSDSDTL